MTKLWREDIDEDNDLHKVMIKRDMLIDHGRDDRPVKIKVYYPVIKDPDLRGASALERLRGSKKLPVIVWSHGLGGSVDGAAFLSRYIASYGYIILHFSIMAPIAQCGRGKRGIRGISFVT